MKNEQIQGFESNGTKPTVAVPNQLSDLSDGSRVATNESNIQGLQGQVNTHNGEIANLSNEVVNKASVQYVDQKFNGASKAIAYDSYATMITAFNALADDIYAIGQDVLIQTLQVPDLWVSGIESASVQYTYVNDATFTSELNTNGYVQVGYYKLSALETQKVDLTDYQKKLTAGTNITIDSNNVISASGGSNNAVTLDNSTQEFDDNKKFIVDEWKKISFAKKSNTSSNTSFYNNSSNIVLRFETQNGGVTTLQPNTRGGTNTVTLPVATGTLALKTDIPQYGYQIVVRFASNVINTKFYACVNGKWYPHTTALTISNCSEIILSNESISSGDSFDTTSAVNVFIDDSLKKIYPLSDSAQITIIGPQE